MGVVEMINVVEERTFRASGDRKTAPYVRRKGTEGNNGTPLKNTFGLPAGPRYSCHNATSWCWDDEKPQCYAEKLTRVFPTVHNLLHDNWQTFLTHNRSVPALVRALSPMIDEIIRQADKRGVEPTWRWFWNGDIPSLNFASAMREIAFLYPQVKFWGYTRNFEFVRNLAGPENSVLYLSVDPDNMIEALACKQEHDWVRLAFCADTWDEAQEMSDEFGEGFTLKCPELIDRIPLVKWDASQDGTGACSVCGLCIRGNRNVRFSPEG